MHKLYLFTYSKDCLASQVCLPTHPTMPSVTDAFPEQQLIMNLSYVFSKICEGCSSTAVVNSMFCPFDSH